MTILGISAFFHDSAACLLINGEIIAAAKEERFTRKKHFNGFPLKSVTYCLTEGEISMEQVDYIIFYEKPLLKLERQLKTFYQIAPNGFKQFVNAIRPILSKQIFLRKTLLKGLNKVDNFNRKSYQLLFSEHHLSHAASTFFTSKYNESVILTIDGVGEWCTTAIFKGEQNRIELLKEIHFPNSLGLFYSAFTYFLGYEINSGEYKLMGLAPYGNPESPSYKILKDKFLDQIIKIYDDGSIWLNPFYFSFTRTLKMVDSKRLSKLIGLAKREPDTRLSQAHCDLAHLVQELTEEIIFKLAKEAKRLSNSENLCLAGGVALNCVAVGKLLEKQLFKEIYLQPESGDAGGAIGCALVAQHIFLGQDRIVPDSYYGINLAYLGPSFTNQDISELNEKKLLKFEHFQEYSDLVKLVAEELSSGKIIGWFQGRMEFGPRALGNRSILADPRYMESLIRINSEIKKRELFRPLSPSILEENLTDFFETDRPDLYMSSISRIKKEIRKPLPDNYKSLNLIDKLKVERSNIQAVTHVDFTSRIQTVTKETNWRFWKLLVEFKQLTGFGVLLNTSFNTNGEPIVCTPKDAYETFVNSNLDLLVMNNFLYRK
ncbi:carbamoyltransferase N-terminal domain-containing protein [Cytophaga sp. FL35]|uniref:carbamoyltransferase family protein n=1 Tax=Cytophaga sp. FL35 TaxID=1904456 RepID=UPI00165382E8|nr:carbamoyltransferase N-terminal domain-containing protein [Cytophaga sp. FL35]MBC7000610.1 hypothetical protein [Cytophaga sp. FL35]